MFTECREHVIKECLLVGGAKTGIDSRGFSWSEMIYYRVFNYPWNLNKKQFGEKENTKTI